MSFNNHKQNNFKTSVCKPFQQDIDRVPGQFSDYMNAKNNRFSEICQIYLEGMSLDDVAYLKPDDIINIVPANQYKHKLLMTIMVRRYLYRSDELNTPVCEPLHAKPDTQEYRCDNCDHVCANKNCSHSCSDYVH
jgi:hypothetical protein